MNDLIAQSLWNREHAPVYDCSSRSRGDGRHMASSAADAREQILAVASSRGSSQDLVTRRNHRTAYELSKMVDVRQPETIRVIFKICCGLADSGDIHFPQPVCNSHLVDISIGNE